jgi:hypothetical protein
VEISPKTLLQVGSSTAPMICSLCPTGSYRFITTIARPRPTHHYFTPSQNGTVHSGKNSVSERTDISPGQQRAE